MDVKDEFKALPPDEELKTQILKRRSEVLAELKLFYERVYGNSQPRLQALKASITSLFIDLEAAMETSLKNKSMEELRQQINHKDIWVNIAGFKTINRWLYLKGITKFDTEKGKRMY